MTYIDINSYHNPYSCITITLTGHCDRSFNLAKLPLATSAK